MTRWNLNPAQHTRQDKAPPGANAGLWLDKCLDAASNDKEIKAKHVERVAAIPPPQAYAAFYERWQASLQRINADCRKASLYHSRLAIGLGDESVLETAISLHRTYGVPFIPGSALKGLAASFARNQLDDSRWQKEGKAYQFLFGFTTGPTESQQGCVTFFDALYCPESGATPLRRDTITVHHPEYYNGTGYPPPPADWDSPTPIPFLSATGTFLLALKGMPEWVDAAYQILSMALIEMGIGAKTSSGYGRMVIEGMEPDEVTRQSGAEEPQLDKFTYVQKRDALLKESPPPGRERGTIKVDAPGKSYFFAYPAGGGAQVLIHPKQLNQKNTHLKIDQVIEYALDKTRSQPSAISVDILLEP